MPENDHVSCKNKTKPEAEQKATHCNKIHQLLKKKSSDVKSKLSLNTIMMLRSDLNQAVHSKLTKTYVKHLM